MKTKLFILICIFSLFISCGSTPKSENQNVKTHSSTKKNSEKLKNQNNDFEKQKAVIPVTEMFLLDDFEDGNYWYAVRNSWDEWGTHNLSLTAELSNEWGTAGLTSLNCSMEAATSHTSKQACWCSDAPLITDFSPYKYLVVDCFNPESSDFNISFAIQTNKWSKWIATPTENVPNGEHTLVFCFEGIFNEEDLSNVNRIILQSLGENNGGHIYFDNIRLYK